MLIKVPQINKWSRRIGVERISEVLNRALAEAGPVIFDFTDCHFISAEGVALLAGVKLMRDSRGLSTNIDVDSINYSIKRLLAKSQLLVLFGYQPDLLRAGNTFPIYRGNDFSKNSITDMLEYIDREILRRSEMPEMSDDLCKQVRKSFSEVFSNIFYHGESPIGGIVCGQVYPKSKEIQIVFYDAGIGMARRIRGVYPSISSDEKAIEWALQKGISTRSNEPSGLGLYLLRQFLVANGGELLIYANKGALSIINGNISWGILPYSIRGTLIDMRIKIRNDVTYIFSYEE